MNTHHNYLYGSAGVSSHEILDPVDPQQDSYGDYFGTMEQANDYDNHRNTYNHWKS